jgi:hypothetical protein
MTDPHSLTQDDISIQSIIDALLNVDETFPPKYLYRLSDLRAEEVNSIRKVWADIPEWRRRALIEDTESMFERDYLLSYESLLRIGIQDQEPQIRFICLRSLSGYEVPDLVSDFIEIMNSDPDPEVREIATSMLGKYVYMGETESISHHKLERITESLLTVFNSGEQQTIRRKALEALGYSSNDNIPQLIKNAYRSTDPEWKASAINAMGKSYIKQFARIIIKELDSLHENIRLEAIRAAGELEISEAAPKLIDNLEDSNMDIRLTSVWSLSQIGGSGVKRSIEALLDEDVTDKEAKIINDALEYLEFNDSFDLDDFDDYDDYDDDDDLYD